MTTLSLFLAPLTLLAFSALALSGGGCSSQSDGQSVLKSPPSASPHTGTTAQIPAPSEDTNPIQQLDVSLRPLDRRTLFSYSREMTARLNLAAATDSRAQQIERAGAIELQTEIVREVAPETLTIDTNNDTGQRLSSRTYGIQTLDLGEAFLQGLGSGDNNSLKSTLAGLLAPHEAGVNLGLIVSHVFRRDDERLEINDQETAATTFHISGSLIVNPGTPEAQESKFTLVVSPALPRPFHVVSFEVRSHSTGISLAQRLVRLGSRLAGGITVTIEPR